MLTVDYNSLTTAEELHLNPEEYSDLEDALFYEGVPFTGLAVTETEKLRHELSYANGFRHGESKGDFLDGGKCYSGHFENGQEVGEHFGWNENGATVEYENFTGPYTRRLYDDLGVLYYESVSGGNVTFFYGNGLPLLIEENGRDVKVFAPSSELTLTKKYNGRDTEAYKQHGKYTTEFEDAVLKEHFVEMAAFLEVRIDIFRWLAKNYQADPSSFAAQGFISLIEGAHLNVKSDAMMIAGELRCVECLPVLEKYLHDHSIPKTESDRVTGNPIPVTARISGMAHHATQKINESETRTPEENESFWRSFFITK